MIGHRGLAAWSGEVAGEAYLVAIRGEIARDVALDLRLGHVAVRHLMDNQTLRQPAAAPAQARASFADADTMTAEAALRFGSTRAYLEIGADAELTDPAVAWRDLPPLRNPSME